jgi:quinol-cytochrome oxidoreductase complex cytochrome b subunit
VSGKTFLERIGWKEYLRPFLYKELPPHTGWSATLGSLCAVLFGMMAVSGVVLAMYYNPSPDKAYQSIDYIMKDVPMGAVLRGIHHWGAGAMVLAVFVHMMASFFSGAFKPPREWTWIAGVCLLLATFGLGFTGYLLPWDMKSYWATVVSTNIPKDIPVIGEFITRAVRGGETVSGLTLTRFYAIHMLLLPALLAGFMAFHIYLVRLHDLAETKPGTAVSGKYRFYPEHLFRSALVFTAVFLVIVGLAVLRKPPREEIAGTLIESYLPRPEWYFMWLFQLLTFFPGHWELVGSLAIPILGVVLLFAVPFLGKTQASGLAQRPLAMGVGVTCVVGIVYLTLMGFEGARPYGRIIVVPDRPLTVSETRGLRLFVDRDCAYCHQIRGKGGHRTGPDLSNVVAKGRTRDYLVRYIRNPQLVSPTSIMPKYNLPESDLQALADFLLALDFSRNPPKILKREEVLHE